VLGSPRVSRIVVIDGTGIEMPDHPIADFFALRMDQVAKLSYHDPARFRIDPTTLPSAAQALMAGNRAALAVYAGTAMFDPSLRERLSTMTTPTLVLWGDSDRIVDPDYGRALAEAIPTARFQLLTDTGHLPQIETPDKVLQALLD
jgi:pimeloyl-ACP methyl ester carboxylesterase